MPPLVREYGQVRGRREVLSNLLLEREYRRVQQRAIGVLDTRKVAAGLNTAILRDILLQVRLTGGQGHYNSAIEGQLVNDL